MKVTMLPSKPSRLQTVNMTNPHFSLATTGVAINDGAGRRLLYDGGATCLCVASVSRDGLGVCACGECGMTASSFCSSSGCGTYASGSILFFAFSPPQADCQPSNGTYYNITHAGLDGLIQEYFDHFQALILSVGSGVWCR